MKETPDKKVQYRRLGAKCPRKQVTCPITKRPVAIKKNGADLNTASLKNKFKLNYIEK